MKTRLLLLLVMAAALPGFVGADTVTPTSRHDADVSRSFPTHPYGTGTLLRRAIGPEAFDFFYPRGTEWDAALDGSVIPAAAMPGAEVIDFRKGWEPADEPRSEWWNEWGAPRRCRII